MSACVELLAHAARVLGELHLHHPALLLDERGRYLDRIALAQLVDDLLGQHGVGAIFQGLLQARVHVGPELDQRLEAADVLGELVVESREDTLL